MTLSLGDFKPINNWEVEINGDKYNDGTPPYIKDLTTGRLYLNETKDTVRKKCFLLTIGTPIVHTFAFIINIVIRAFKVLTFYHFWTYKPEEQRTVIDSEDWEKLIQHQEVKYNFKARIADTGHDLVKLFLSILSIPVLTLSAIYGLANPYDGRKLYASMERATYGNRILAPCFQPNPDSHFFGGDISTQNAY